jgi:hypothetical protein
LDWDCERDTGGGSGRKKMDCLTPPRIGAIYVIGRSETGKGSCKAKGDKAAAAKDHSGPNSIYI